ncbi:MAG: hypothetical protein F6K31_13195 [Symploca sp. SIO2G7]|nr:hypothetical protein [Symploca sp. SIO2G7]
MAGKGTVLEKPEEVTEIGYHKAIGEAEIKVEKEEGFCFPSLWDNGQIVWSGGCVKSFDKARNMATIAYNRYTRIFEEEGLAQVDPDFLIRLPYNELIYVNNSSNIDRLVEELGVEQPELLPLTVDQWGIIIDGNSRHAAVEILNSQSEQEKKFPRIPIEIRRFEDELERLQALKLRNSYRAKSRIQLLIEAQLAVQIEAQLAKKRMQAGVKLDKRRRSIDTVANRLGVGAKSLRSGFGALEAIQKVKESHPELARKWARLLEDASSKTALDIEGVPLEDREAVIDKLYDEDGVIRKKVSVERAYQELKAERLRELEKAKKKDETEKSSSKSSTKSSSQSSTPSTASTDNSEVTEELEESELVRLAQIKTQRELGDKASDNWYTPKEVVNLVIEVLGEIDLDAFADLGKRIPAKKHYTIVDDAFLKKNHWEGSVFANILYSDQTKCLQEASREIASGHTKTGIYLCESGVLFNKRTQDVIEKHEMSICIWRGKIEFVPGDLLLEENPDVVGSSSRINSVFLLYGDELKKRHFEEIFSVYGGVYHDASYFLNQYVNPIDAIRQINWKSGKAVFGDIKMTVRQEDDLWIAEADGKTIDSLVSEDEAQIYAIAIALKGLLHNPFANF